jgi:hypothetical protein
MIILKTINSLFFCFAESKNIIVVDDQINVIIKRDEEVENWEVLTTEPERRKYL